MATARVCGLHQRRLAGIDEPRQGLAQKLKVSYNHLNYFADRLRGKRRNRFDYNGRRATINWGISTSWSSKGSSHFNRRTADLFVVEAPLRCLSAAVAVVVESSADYYQVLKIDRDADMATIKRAYRQLAKEYHPDVNPSASAHDMFVILSTAYEVLIDDEQRSLYDKHGVVQDGSSSSLRKKGGSSAMSVWEETWGEFKRTTRRTRKGDARAEAESSASAVAAAVADDKEAGSSSSSLADDDDDGNHIKFVAMTGDVVEYPLSEAAKARYCDGRTLGVGFIVSRNLDRGDRDKLPAQARDLVELEPLYREPGEEHWVVDPLESAHFTSLRFVRRLRSEYNPKKDSWTIVDELSCGCGSPEYAEEIIV